MIPRKEKNNEEVSPILTNTALRKTMKEMSEEMSRKSKARYEATRARIDIFLSEASAEVKRSADAIFEH
ncbi:MAG: hypothetical protein ACHQNE_00390 [Candidatus Kapaibacterium sp.]